MCMMKFKNTKTKMNYCKIFSSGLILVFFLWIIPYPLGKYIDSSFHFIPEEDVPSELIGLIGSSEKGTNWCLPLSPHLRGMDFKVHETLQENLHKEDSLADSLNIQPGGIWQPAECQARYEVVIIVPYRNRPKQLRKFLTYMHPFLQRQQLHYKIIVVEQNDDKPFNRARLLNIGFKEAERLGPPNYCFIFHDVDLIPQNDYNIYACTHQPRHMYSSIDIFRYHLPYRSLFGGALAILSPHFREVNGFSNSFYGWGGEDDDFSMRLQEKGLLFERFDPRVARYVMMPHKKEKPAANRWQKLAEHDHHKSKADGLSTLQYDLDEVRFFPLYTRIFVK